jgi:DNA-binding NarL/FixJ family response regulator
VGIQSPLGLGHPRALHGAGHGYRVCVYTMDRRPYFFAHCLRTGAHGLVLKTDPLDALVDCLRRIAQGATAVSRGIAARVGIAAPRR